MNATQSTEDQADTLRNAIRHSESHHPNSPCHPGCSGWAPTQAYRKFLGMPPAVNPYDAKGRLKPVAARR